jgi:hypothetical protein
MCCLFTILALLGPRALILVWWVLEPLRWNAAFETFIWPFLGFLFAPWTTLSYIVVYPGGIDGFDWVIIGLAVVLDIVNLAGGAYGNRRRLGYDTYNY